MSFDENEHPEEVSQNEFLADIAVRLVERDLLAGDTWRVAYGFGLVLDCLVEAANSENEELQEFATVLLMEITQTMLYAHVHVLPSEEDIETSAQRFADMLNNAEEIRKNKREEPNNGN